MVLADERVGAAAERFHESARLWRRVSDLVAEAGRIRGVKPLRAAAEELPTIAEIERRSMELLQALD